MILVGYDGSPSSEAALAFGFREASRRQWQLTVLHVVRSPEPDDFDEAKAWLTELVRERDLAFPGIRVEPELLRGHPMDGLSDATRRRHWWRSGTGAVGGSAGSGSGQWRRHCCTTRTGRS